MEQEDTNSDFMPLLHFILGCGLIGFLCWYFIFPRVFPPKHIIEENQCQEGEKKYVGDEQEIETIEEDYCFHGQWVFFATHESAAHKATMEKIHRDYCVQKSIDAMSFEEYKNCQIIN